MHKSSSPVGDTENQEDKAYHKQNESISESTKEVKLTIVVCNGDPRGETEELAQKEDSPNKVCLSNFQEQCRTHQKQSESKSDEVKLTIVVCNGDSVETEELIQKKDSPNKVCLSNFQEQCKTPQKHNESITDEVKLTIVVCNGDSSQAQETTEFSQKACLSRNGSFHEQCRVCQQEKEEVLIVLGCNCRGGLAKAHRSCIDAWFRTKGSNQCEICQVVAVNVTPPETQPITNYWVWRIDPSYRQQERQRRCFSPLWVAFSILIGGLMLDVLISITLGISALPVNIIVGVIVVLGLGTALRLTLELCYDWSLRRAVHRADSNFTNIVYPPAL